MADITFERNGKTFTLLQETSPKEAIVESVDSTCKGNDVFWFYAVSGMHSGEPFHIAVKNPHYDADGDESGTWYYLTDDGKFWADDFTEISDNVDDWYSDVINDAVREDFKSL